jgi:AraC family cel operon transcriptional repressor
MLHVINTEGTINMESETHYAIHTQINKKEYPQVHDFYEFTFLASGKLKYILDGKTYILEEGDLIFIRPGQVHSKIYIEPLKHINLAFPKSTLDSMFTFVYSKEIKENFLKQKELPIIRFNRSDRIVFESQLEKLTYFPVMETQKIKTYLRAQLALLFTKYLIPVITKNDLFFETELIAPIWLTEALIAMRDSESYAEGLDWIVKHTGKSKEHICRSFKKYINKTPSAVINYLRLNYVANLLAHTDKEIIEIVYDAGFQSLSYFYALFKKEFGTTPKKFRETSFYN